MENFAQANSFFNYVLPYDRQQIFLPDTDQMRSAMQKEPLRVLESLSSKRAIGPELEKNYSF